MPKRRSPRPRADELLAERGFAETARAAASLILAGRVLVTDSRGRERRVEKAGERLEPGVRFRLKGDRRPYASRAGLKLEGALDSLGVDPSGRVCLDLGLSTGGFTDCLLARGARRVHGVDVAFGIVDWRVRTDPRLILHERTNARQVTPDLLGETVSLVVVDLSFIGLSAVWPVLPPVLEPEGDVLALVKPQFELPREDVERGVVLDDEARRRAVEAARGAARATGLEPRSEVESVLPGREGNREVVLHLRRG
jgi:23S rRNA (cytidine1920-2'-O)/16S rRNA (cytidine1409-2'-O)-methyltransferase